MNLLHKTAYQCWRYIWQGIIWYQLNACLALGHKHTDFIIKQRSSSVIWSLLIWIQKIDLLTLYFFNFLHIFFQSTMWMYVNMYMSQLVCRIQRTTFSSQLFPFIMWVLRFELKSSRLASGMFTHWVMSLAPNLLIYWFSVCVYAHMCVCAHTHAPVCTDTCVQLCIGAHMYSGVYVCVWASVLRPEVEIRCF